MSPAISSRGSGIRQAGPVPRVSKLWLAWFAWYARGYIARHFHSLRVSRGGLPVQCRDLPLVVYVNHASWWDPLVCLAIKEAFFADRMAFAPIDAAMLERYPFFRRLGFFGVEQNSRRGAGQFLRAAEAVLSSRERMLFITPQGRFADVRERPAQFAGGMGHLAARVNHAWFLPLALEYVFWEERLPEILARFGEPVEIGPGLEGVFDAEYWRALFESKLEETQDALAADARRRDPEDFEVLLRGGAGTSRIYDGWRRWRARLNGRVFRKEHGDK